MKPNDFEMITVEEFAARMGVSRSTVFVWLAKGYLAEGKIYVRLGKTIRFIWSLDAIAALAQQADAKDSDEPKGFAQGRKKSQINLEF